MLPVHPHPRDDEILSCWMVRLAVGNRFKLHHFYVRLLGHTGPIWTRDVDRHPAPDLIKLLSEQTGHPPQRVRDMSLLAYEGTLMPSVNSASDVSSWIIPLGIYHRTRRRDGMQFCPICLAEDGPSPYFRRQWRLALNCICERHGCLLQSHCPNCSQPISYFRHDFNHLVASTSDALATCWMCHFDLRTSTPEYLDCAPSAWPWLLDAMDVLQPIKGFAWTSSAVTLAYYQGIMILVRALSCRNGGQLLSHLLQEIAFPGEFPVDPHHQGLSGMSMRQRIALLLAVGYLIGEWPDRFIACCRQCHVRRTNFIELFHVTPWWLYSTIVLNFDGRVYRYSQEEVAAVIRYLLGRKLKITVRNLRRVIGMTNNAARIVKNDYLSGAP